jgi:uncharacterized FAD-dependent dehydrogenase
MDRGEIKRKRRELMEKIVIVGAGASGIATAIELISNGYNGKDILMIDKGHMIDKRKCFVNENTPCKKCKVCSITHGCGGSGSFSDSKLNFDPTGRIGGDMAELMTKKEIEYYLRMTYEIYKRFGIEEFQSKIYGLDYTDEVKNIIKTIKNNPRLDIGECATLHLGTDNSRIIYKRMLDYLLANNVEIKCNTELKTVEQINGKFLLNGEIKADKLVLALGRSGNKLVKNICDTNNIKIKNGRVDIGVRVECPNEVMKKLNENFYECKIYFKGSFGDNARMFCTNPSGFVTVESYPYYDKKIFTANGHSYRNKHSNNTNFAILVSRNFNEDLENPLENYVYPSINVANSLGKGSVIVQSLGDINKYRRSTEERINELNIIPTVNVYKGDITSVIPYRTLATILEFINELDSEGLAKGLGGDDTLLYYPECKFHSNKVLIDKYGKTSNPNVYCIGDCSGYVRGLTTAFSHGILCAEDILNNIDIK